MENNVVSIESIDQEGRGIAHHEGKVIFIEGALPGERVTYASYRRKPSFEMAQATSIANHSFMRVQPKCIHFGVCGGCAMQHLDSGAQVAVKQRILEENLARIGKVKPETILSPIHGSYWGYRQRARIGVRHVLKKGRTLVGFHEKRSSFVADLSRCEILSPKISALIPLLSEMIHGLSIRDHLPQIEIACGDDVDVLVLRIMQPLTADDEATLRAFADAHDIQFWLQTKGPETVVPFHPLVAPPLSYSLPEFAVEMPFAPTEFTQVNHQLNRVMVHRALRLLDAQSHENIADFFCGLGNFTLPIARSGAQVLGVEGSAALVKRAMQGAEHNGLTGNTKFMDMNLFEMDEEKLKKLGSFDKWLVDPPRDGAFELLKSITPETAPQRIVYVSCNPATLARDAEVLVRDKGYVLKAAGVMNMFPQTAHVESIALFVREEGAAA
ncbi:MAG: 23S rRNA (uracil(1939)-C(5))-methyltransferase RlmD [Gammaproteobacteria bacterium]|nr:23S rRNA (uracil(1939)-C(5))-methyltransferase RlmD [Gammaproteobacteria bacterium]MBU1625602.1 23S rRNA (uracil(1939)-C(5))-methyltransferase RlmD [Gammaproteobacteria bacterium]MBU1980862.1 23S rRNA (uracil(1939)-C(5))-methyltransferase RlmD [Gammaproteobacteria bacterium]